MKTGKAKCREIAIVLSGANPFDLSREGWKLFGQRKGVSFHRRDFDKPSTSAYQKLVDTNGKKWDSAKIRRDDPDLIVVIRQLSCKATNWCYRLGICVLPKSAKYEIRDDNNYSRDSAGYRDGGVWEVLYELKDGWERKIEPVEVIE